MSKAIFLKKLGKQLVAVRTSKGISQTQLAHLCGKDPQSIDRVERGKVNPSVYYLNELAEALQITLAELLDF